MFWPIGGSLTRKGLIFKKGRATSRIYGTLLQVLGCSGTKTISSPNSVLSARLFSRPLLFSLVLSCRESLEQVRQWKNDMAITEPEI